MSRLADVCELITDGTHFTPQNVPIGIPFLTVKDVSDHGLDFEGCAQISEADYAEARAGNSAPRAGDVLFSKDGTVGKVHVVTSDRPFAVLSSLAILRPDARNLDSRYLGHVLRSPSVLSQANSRKTGSAIRRIVLSDLRQLTIPVPPIATQRQIAGVLDRVDDLRGKRRVIRARLDELAGSLFEATFGDPLSQTPWPTAKLETLCRRVTDGTHQPPKWSEAGVPFLFVRNIVSGEIDFDTTKFISDETHRELTRRCPIETGDVLYSTVGSYGVPAVVRDSRKFAFQRHIAHIKPDPNLLDSEFLRAMLASTGVRRQADEAARGIAQKTVNLADIKAFRVLRPDLGTQREFSRLLTAIRRLQESQRESHRTVESLYRSLQGHLLDRRDTS